MWFSPDPNADLELAILGAAPLYLQECLKCVHATGVACKLSKNVRLMFFC